MAHDFRYPIVLTPDEGTLLVTVPDIPEAITFGEDEADALARAADVIESALAGYMRDRRDIPTPSAAAAGRGDDGHPGRPDGRPA